MLNYMTTDQDDDNDYIGSQTEREYQEKQLNRFYSLKSQLKKINDRKLSVVYKDSHWEIRDERGIVSYDLSLGGVIDRI